jgi:trigger factor
MHIEREETGTLTATLKVKLMPEDYNPGVEKALKEQRKNAVLPGFRPGAGAHAPDQEARGRTLLVTEVERLIDENLRLPAGECHPGTWTALPKREANDANNWDEPGELSFAYELGLAPSFEVELNEKLGVTYPVVDVNDGLVQREIDDMQRRFGKLEDATTSEANDMLLGDMIELEADGTIKAGGIMNRATISLEYLADDTVRNSLVGKAAGEEMLWTRTRWRVITTIWPACSGSTMTGCTVSVTPSCSASPRSSGWSKWMWTRPCSIGSMERMRSPMRPRSERG